MFKSIVVVDDFYDDPHQVRATALKFTYPEETGKVTYPGRNSRQTMLPPNSDEMFSFLVQEPVMGGPGMWHGICRIALANHQRTGQVHVDQRCAWAGVICLTPDKHCVGGTEFYRHKKYGTQHMPFTDKEAQEIYGCENRGQVLDMLFGPGKDGRDLDKWEKVFELPLKFNRCVLFRPWFFHRSGPDFGDSIENGRLIQLLFLVPGKNAQNMMTVPAAGSGG